MLFDFHESRDASGRNANKVVLYEDSSKKQLQEFISALRGLELMAQACLSLGVILNNVKSRQLSHLLTPGTVISINKCYETTLQLLPDALTVVNCR
jgi:DNA mismatch repair protein MSH6